ncbi:hypothetical protein AAHA92_17281 [Salvia divinorum]|uniref:Uncharacterized protein n=1 Tax=Salvia divinorum TaxID=28513 RepID=A0ABD1H2B9_SALDI
MDSTDVGNLHAVSIVTTCLQEYSEGEQLQEKFEAGGVEELERGAAEWFEDIQTQGLTDQELPEAIMSFCQVPKAVEPKGRRQAGNIERLPKIKEPNLLNINRGVSTKVMCGVVDTENVIDPERKEGDGGEVNEEKDKRDSIPLTQRSRGERNIENEKSILPLTYPLIPRPETCEELRLDSYDSASRQKKRTKLQHDRNLKNRELKIGQRVLLFQSKPKSMARKWKSKWTKPFTIGALGADEAIGLRGSPPNSESFVICCLRAKVCKDSSVLCVVREISLRMTVLSFT